jgi:hypothetical protein
VEKINAADEVISVLRKKFAHQHEAVVKARVSWPEHTHDLRLGQAKLSADFAAKIAYRLPLAPLWSTFHTKDTKKTTQQSEKQLFLLGKHQFLP